MMQAVIVERFVIGLLSAALISMPLAASGAEVQACFPRADLATRLAEAYGEAPAVHGVADGGGVMELFARPDGASWTIVITFANGYSCPIAAGEALRPGVHSTPAAKERSG